MKIAGLEKIFVPIGGFLTKNSPAILTGMSVAGLVTTVVLAVRATPKALELIQEENETREDEDKDVLSYPEQAKLVWKCYLPAAVMGGITIACILSAHSISAKRNAALATVYALTETSLKDYKAKVKEVVGEGKLQKVTDAIAHDKVAKNPPNDATIIFTGKGETLCYDTISGRYFKSDIETIRQIQNELNQRLISEMTLTLNEVYYELGLANIKLGDEMGFDSGKGLIEFHFSSQLTPEGKPCLVLDYTVDPLFLAQ